MADCDLEDDGTEEHSLSWPIGQGHSFGTDNTDRERDEADTEPWLVSPERHETRGQVGLCNGTCDDGEIGEGDDEPTGDQEPDASGIADHDALLAVY